MVFVLLIADLVSVLGKTLGRPLPFFRASSLSGAFRVYTEVTFDGTKMPVQASLQLISGLGMISLIGFLRANHQPSSKPARVHFSRSSPAHKFKCFLDEEVTNESKQSCF